MNFVRLIFYLPDQVDYPFLVLLISGGHCLLAVVKDVATFYLLGKTIDNAPGEAFDKVTRGSTLQWRCREA